jgi:ADP-ribosyl-[dinitrogen reductase] hydrolase
MATTAVFVDRAAAALWGIFIADALSMPVHWYYDTSALKRDYGKISTYQAPKEKHPTSIMNLASTGVGGRGSQSASIVGDVILKGKKHLWGKSGTHYHHGMKAGENTLNALCSRVLMRSITSSKSYDSSRFLKDYVEFMTSPGSHGDTYAESYHRDFFSNWVRGVPPEKCAGEEKHDTPSIGGFVTIPPVVLASMELDTASFLTRIKSHLFLTHKSDSLASYAEIYAVLLRDILNGANTRVAVQAAGNKIGLDIEAIVKKGLADEKVVGGMFGMACYITDSFPNILYLAFKYADNFSEGVLANTNCGGENCHRGSALGAILGAANGMKGIPDRFINDLKDSATIKAEIEDFLNAVMVSQKADL